MFGILKNILANCDGNLYLPIFHLPSVELRCKLQEKLHRVTGPLVMHYLKAIEVKKWINSQACNYLQCLCSHV